MNDQITPTMVQAAASVLWNDKRTDTLPHWACEEIARKMLEAAMKARGHAHEPKT